MNILIVDDEKDIREYITHCVVQAVPSPKIVEATGGAEAQLKCRNMPFQLVVTDIRMPSGNGVELITYLRSIKPKPKVIVMSGFFEDPDNMSQKLGIPVLSKPFKFDIVTKAIQNILGLEEKNVEISIKINDSTLTDIKAGDVVVSKASLGWGFGIVKGLTDKGMYQISFSKPPKGMEGLILVNPQNIIREKDLTENQKKRLDSLMH